MLWAGDRNMRYRILWATACSGLAVHFVGLGWDAYRHSADSTLAQRADVLSLANPSHLMIIGGIAIVAASLLGMAAIWMNDHRFGGEGAPGSLLRGILLPAIAVASAATIWLASTAQEAGQPDTSVFVHELTARPPIPPSGQSEPQLSAADAPRGESHDHSAAPAAPVASGGALAEENAHTHGNEVAASAEQLLAAGQFAMDVKAKTAKYADIRDAMAAGYVQITQDLPGIAAHFIRTDYQHDGHELDPDYPETLLYTKRLDGTWRLIGVMFLAESVSDTPPSYFGPLDVWHRHENLCFISGGRVMPVTEATKCPGLFVARTAYQIHVWTEPGGTGVFAHDFAPISPGPFPGATVAAASELRAQAR